MRTYTTEAIVLKRFNLGEADRVLTLYTADRGRVSAIVRGSRKPSSRLGGHVELFSVSQLTLREGKTFDLVTAAALSVPHRGLAEKVERTHAAHFVAEAVLQLTVEAVVIDRLFALVSATLAYLDQAHKPAGILAGFQVKLLTLLGHQPVIDRCVHCDTQFAAATDRPVVGFDLVHGGLVCSVDAAELGHGLIPCSTAGQQALARLLGEPMHETQQQLPGFREASRIIEQAVLTQTERPLKSRAFLTLTADSSHAA